MSPWGLRTRLRLRGLCPHGGSEVGWWRRLWNTKVELSKAGMRDISNGTGPWGKPKSSDASWIFVREVGLRTARSKG